MATGTRDVALRLWNGRLPERDPAELVRELYAAENRGQARAVRLAGHDRLDLSRRQPAGLRFRVRGRCISRGTSNRNNDPQIARWLERVIHMCPSRRGPEGYNPLGVKNLDAAVDSPAGPDRARTATTRSCGGMLPALGASMNECMRCWEAILPHTVRHPTLTVDLVELLQLLPGALCRRHVLRLRRRLSVRRLRRAGARRVSRPGEPGSRPARF